MSNKQVLGGFRAPRKVSVSKVRDYDDKTLLIYESPGDLLEPSEPFMAQDTEKFLDQAKLSVTAEVEREDGTTVPADYPVNSMSDLEPEEVRRNCPVIREQHIKRTALKSMQAMLPRLKKEASTWDLPIAERKARAAAFRQFARQYRQLGK